MSDSRDEERLRQLEARIAAAKSARETARPQQEEHYSQAQVAWRMVIELVAGLGIGFGIGYGLDVLLGTIPIFLVLFTFLGFAAGVQTMLRTAKEVQEKKRVERALDSAAPGAADDIGGASVSDDDHDNAPLRRNDDDAPPRRDE